MTIQSAHFQNGPRKGGLFLPWGSVTLAFRRVPAAHGPTLCYLEPSILSPAVFLRPRARPYGLYASITGEGFTLGG